MTNQKTFITWLSGMMLAYAFMLPVANGAISDPDTTRKSEIKQEAKQELNQKVEQKDEQKVQQDAGQKTKHEEGKNAGKHKHSHFHKHSHSHDKLSAEEIQQIRLKKMQYLAQYFDISIEGKSVDQLRAEIDKAKKENPEKWEAFKQEFRAKKLDKMREYAKSKGIDTKGKSLEQLHDELYELKERSSK